MVNRDCHHVKSLSELNLKKIISGKLVLLKNVVYGPTWKDIMKFKLNSWEPTRISLTRNVTSHWSVLFIIQED